MNALTRLPGEFKYFASDVSRNAAASLVPEMTVKMFRGESVAMPELSRWQTATLMFNKAREMPQERQLAARILPKSVTQKIPAVGSAFNMGAAIFTGAYGGIKGPVLIKTEFKDLVYYARHHVDDVSRIKDRYTEDARRAGLKISDTGDAIVINSYPTMDWHTAQELPSFELARFSKGDLLRADRGDDIVGEFIRDSGFSKLGETAQELAKLQQQFPETTIITHTPPISRYGHINPRKFRFELQFPAGDDGQRLSYEFPEREYESHFNVISSEVYAYSSRLRGSHITATSEGWRVADSSGRFAQTFTRLQDAAAWYENIDKLVLGDPELTPFHDMLKPMDANINYWNGQGYFLHAIASLPWSANVMPGCDFRYGKIYSDLGAFKKEVLEPLQYANEKIAAAGKSLKVGYDYNSFSNDEGLNIHGSKVFFVVTDADGKKTNYQTLEELNAAYP